MPTSNDWVTLIMGIFLFPFSVRAEFQEHEERPNNRSGDKPEINTAPHNVLTLRGHKDPKLEIWFSVTYSTTNPACETASPWQKIVGSPPIPQTIYDSVQAKSGQSEISIPVYLDRYLSGKCNWQPIGILHRVHDPSMPGKAGYSGLLSIRLNAATKTNLAYLCRNRTVIPPQKNGLQR